MSLVCLFAHLSSFLHPILRQSFAPIPASKRLPHDGRRAPKEPASQPAASPSASSAASKKKHTHPKKENGKRTSRATRTRLKILRSRFPCFPSDPPHRISICNKHLKVLASFPTHWPAGHNRRLKVSPARRFGIMIVLCLSFLCRISCCRQYASMPGWSLEQKSVFPYSYLNHPLPSP
ncbi:hypothetical protein HDK90DRAFT_294104 [Phyllosticta capitalensis]|uniref:Uncharacterized protein n=1 Tax=Phyllosticta capitalensis TaxID=121624 RepID=A0ABR1YL81_9PEZI